MMVVVSGMLIGGVFYDCMFCWFDWFDFVVDGLVEFGFVLVLLLCVVDIVVGVLVVFCSVDE